MSALLKKRAHQVLKRSEHYKMNASLQEGESFWRNNKFNDKNIAKDEIENAMQIDKYIQHDNPFIQDVKISAPIVNVHDISYHMTLASQRDTLSNILIMESATTICIVMVSRRGNVTLMSGSNLSQSVGPAYQLPVIPGGQKVVSGTRSKGCSWVCDATVMHDAKAIVYALSDRSLHFYDTACSLRSDAVQEHRHLWKVVGLPHSITSLFYYKDASLNSSILFLGDEQGSIISITFLQPSTVLFQRRGLEARPGYAESVYWPEILKNGGPHSQHVVVKVERHVHCEAVLQIHYYPEHQTIMSNALDTKKSLVSWHKTGKLPTYTHNLDEGVRCFAFNARYQQLATGSDDGIIRLWNPLVTSKPTAFLSGHEAPVVDVIFVTNEELLFTLCKFAELRLWHTKYQCCLQTIQLTPPQTQHWAAPRSLLMWQKNSQGDTLLVSLGPRLAEIPLDLDACKTDSLSSQSESENKPEEEILTREDWQQQQVQNLVEQAHNMEINVDDETTSKSTSTSASLKDFETDKHLLVPHINLRLEKYPSIAFQKPMFSPSAIEIINFSDDEEDDTNKPDKHATGMNERIEGQARILSKKRYFVEQCAPHLALSLWPPSVISAPNNIAKSSAHL